MMMTTSDDQQDKVNSFSSGAAGYVPKPLGYSQFVEVMRSKWWTNSVAQLSDWKIFAHQPENAAKMLSFEDRGGLEVHWGTAGSSRHHAHYHPSRDCA